MNSTRLVQAARSHPVLVLWLGITSGLAVTHAFLPPRAAVLTFLGVAATSVLAMVLGPLARKPVVRRPFRWLALAAGTMVSSTLVTVIAPATATSWPPKALALAGYWCVAAFFWDLLRSAQGRVDMLGLSDASMVALGAGLSLWSIGLGPTLLASGPFTPMTLVLIGLPLADAVIAALAMRLAMQAERRTPALLALLLGVIAHVIGDTITFAFGEHGGEATLRVARVCYLLALSLFAVGLAHPTMVRLGERGLGTGMQISLARRISMIAAVLVPGTVSLVIPSRGWADVTVRVTLLAALMGIVQVRLVRTVRALDEAHELTRYHAVHDPLTGLQNRQAFLDHLDRSLAPTASGHAVCVLCMDIDRFTHVNDVWGHPVGDELLRALAERLLAEAGPHAAFRTGADEFALVIDDDLAPEDAEEVIERVRAAVARPFDLRDERRMTITVTAATAASPVGDRSAASLARDAETALSKAKQERDGRLVRFDDSLRAQVHERLLLVEDLRTAVGDGQLDAHFQPIHGGECYDRLVGFEALARWTHPDRGMVSPGEFIPLAEDSGAILEIGEFVMRRATSQLAAWRGRPGGADLHMSVNVSLAQITRSDVAAMVERAVRDAQLPPDALWIEITESLMAEHTGVVMSTLRDLKDLGVALALDDFGTGYSSLSCIADFPIDVVKVDRSFVSRLPHNPRTTALTRGIIEMVRSLGLTGVVAEGVEESDQGAALADMGCTWVQGYHYGRPRPSSEITLQVPADDRPQHARPADAAAALHT